MRDYRFRRVQDLNQLKEKIYLFDDGFDDREVEVLKLIIEMRAAQSEEPITGPLLFSERVSDEKGGKHLRFAHLAKAGMSALTVAASALANVAESLAGRPELDTDDSWPVVDRAFAVKVLKALGAEKLPRE
jgi:hypothetical protein